MFLLALVAGAIGLLFQRLAVAKLTESEQLEPQVREIQGKVNRMQQAYNNLQNTQKEADQITTLMEDRYYWGDLLAELRQALIRSENEIVKKYAAAYAQKYPGQGVEAGIWIEQMTMENPAAATAGSYYNNPNIRNPNIPNPNVPNPNIPNPNIVNAAADGTTASGQTTNAITLVCRAVDLSAVDSSADQEIVYALERELKAAPLFDPKTVQPPAQISAVDPDYGTFTFTITVAPKNPLK